MLSLALGGATLAVTVPGTAQADDKNEHNEKTVSLDQIPAPARATILREAAGGRILKVEQEMEQNKQVYEAHVKKGPDEIGISVDANGALLGKHSEGLEKGGHDND
jgi:uncharacterized membrane protein YkoI